MVKSIYTMHISNQVSIEILCSLIWEDLCQISPGDGNFVPHIHSQYMSSVAGSCHVKYMVSPFLDFYMTTALVMFCNSWHAMYKWQDDWPGKGAIIKVQVAPFQSLYRLGDWNSKNKSWKFEVSIYHSSWAIGIDMPPLSCSAAYFDGPKTCALLGATSRHPVNKLNGKSRDAAPFDVPTWRDKRDAFSLQNWPAMATKIAL